jgi:ABC-2 type transport system ATP-binding protein
MRSYSKGMVQRVGLAQTLIHDPEVYILDEPMSGLDPLGRALVKEIMINLKQRGKSIFFSTHITSDVESVCDRVGIILSGELKTVERVSSVMSEGITGYMIQTRDAANGSTTETYVTKEKLSPFLADIQNSAKEVMLIEPRRKSLEDFFLDVVKTKPC